MSRSGNRIKGCWATGVISGEIMHPENIGGHQEPDNLILIPKIPVVARSDGHVEGPRSLQGFPPPRASQSFGV